MVIASYLLDKAREKGYAEGYPKGYAKGRAEAYKDADEQLDAYYYKRMRMALDAGEDFDESPPKIIRRR